MYLMLLNVLKRKQNWEKLKNLHWKIEKRIPTAEQTKIIMCTVDSAGAGTTGAAGPGAVTSVAMAMANIVDNKSENMFVLYSENEWTMMVQKFKN